MKRFTYRKSFLKATNEDIEAWLRTKTHVGGPLVSLDISVEDHVAHRVYTYSNSGSFIVGYNGFHNNENRAWFLPILPEHLLPPTHLTWERIMPNIELERSRYLGIMDFLEELYTKAGVTMGSGDFPTVPNTQMGKLMAYVRDYAKTDGAMKSSRKIGRYKITRR